VKVFFSTRVNEPIRRDVIDLATDMRDQIESPEPPEKWNFPWLNELWSDIKKP
jgi:hypothetical protein